jgi:hypothetical protein
MITGSSLSGRFQWCVFFPYFQFFISLSLFVLSFSQYLHTFFSESSPLSYAPPPSSSVFDIMSLLPSILAFACI